MKEEGSSKNVVVAPCGSVKNHTAEAAHPLHGHLAATRLEAATTKTVEASLAPAEKQEGPVKLGPTSMNAPCGCDYEDAGRVACDHAMESPVTKTSA